MKAGPSSDSAAARRWPGRVPAPTAARGRASRRAKRRTAGASPEPSTISSNGASAP